MIKSEKDVPTLDECYGYVPALVSGGIESIDNIKILKAIPYIETVLQFIGDLKRVLFRLLSKNFSYILIVLFITNG
jgi:predicted translin family RNA/ssDNA-binding protein